MKTYFQILSNLSLTNQPTINAIYPEKLTQHKADEQQKHFAFGMQPIFLTK
jgi:hypothetical protein